MELINASELIIKACKQAGANVFIGYPITPANHLFQYSRVFDIMLPAPDEISAVQWMAGFAAAGKIPVTATSFPGFALMIESINMAYMMELPLVIILAQRMGPSTGTATLNAQGDISLINGMISGGFPIPTYCPSDFKDCWTLAGKAVQTAVKLSCPVILLTSKEMVMTEKSFDVKRLPKIRPAKRISGGKDTYSFDKHLCRRFGPVGNNKAAVRLTASTHNKKGILQHSTWEALYNTKRLQRKVVSNISPLYEYDQEKDATRLIVSYGITAQAARAAVARLRKRMKISLLICKSLFPVSREYQRICGKYSKIYVAEENNNSQYSEILFGKHNQHRKITSIGRLVSPERIYNAVR